MAGPGASSPCPGRPSAARRRRRYRSRPGRRGHRSSTVVGSSSSPSRHRPSRSSPSLDPEPRRGRPRRVPGVWRSSSSEPAGRSRSSVVADRVASPGRAVFAVRRVRPRRSSRPSSRGCDAGHGTALAASAPDHGRSGPRRRLARPVAGALDRDPGADRERADHGDHRRPWSAPRCRQRPPAAARDGGCRAAASPAPESASSAHERQRDQRGRPPWRTASRAR